MILTTITVYWNRPDMLKRWLRAIEGAKHPEVRHTLFVVGDKTPDGVYSTQNLEIWEDTNQIPGVTSIGHFHNLGAKITDTPWMMKLDLDALPNVRYFQELIPLLKSASPRQWFNGGMFYVGRVGSQRHLTAPQMPVSEDTYLTITEKETHLLGPFSEPAGSNFICRRQDYLDLGGCLEGFSGYGWEDYQQLYMLEKYWREQCPLTGHIDEFNVTQACRDQISRLKAKQLWEINPWLGLLHCWHPRGPITSSKINANRKLLWDYIKKDLP